MVLLPLFPLLNAVLSINSEGPCGTPTRWHAGCSLIRNLKDWLPGVAGTDPRLGYRFGASITKRGLAPAPFFNFRRPPRAIPPASIKTDPHTGRQVSMVMWTGFLAAKKRSGRWGDRPLGRGDGGYSNPESVWSFRRPTALASSRTTQEQK